MLLRGLIPLAMVAGLMMPTAFAQDDSSADPVVATVNGEQIRQSEILMFHQTLPPQYQDVPLEKIFDDLLTNLINRKAIVQAARAEGMNKTAEARRRVAFFFDGVLQEMFLSRAVESAVTEDRLRAAYEKMLRLTPPQEEVKARHILVEKREAAQDIIQQLGSGADFAILAQRHSKGPSSTAGGDLGYFGRDQMVPEFAEVAFALEPGSYSKKPVRTKYGWHIIMVEDRRASPPPSFEESAPQIRRDESRAVVSALVQELMADAKVVRVQRGPPKGE